MRRTTEFCAVHALKDAIGRATADLVEEKWVAGGLLEQWLAVLRRHGVMRRWVMWRRVMRRWACVDELGEVGDVLPDSFANAPQRRSRSVAVAVDAPGEANCSASAHFPAERVRHELGCPAGKHDAGRLAACDELFDGHCAAVLVQEFGQHIAKRQPSKLADYSVWIDFPWLHNFTVLMPCDSQI